MEKQITALSDQDIMTDVLTSQKHITENYNTFTNELVNQVLRDDFLNILREEHNIQASVFDEMKSRGWYNPAQAQQQMINETKTKHQGIAASL